MPELPALDTDHANPARIYDYFLGGFHNFAVDREAAGAIERANPGIRPAIQSNRSFLRRAVTYLVNEAGISQFLDLGSGVPTVGNVHEIAQTVNPTAKVVYVDIEPVAVKASELLLQDNPNAMVLREDMRATDAILGNAQVRRLLDFERPMAVIALSVLHFLPAEEPHVMLRRLREMLTPGGYLVLSHASLDRQNAADAVANRRMMDEYAHRAAAPVYTRTRAEVATMFGDFELAAPGLVQVSQWRPDNDERDDPRYCFYAGIGRKP